VDELVAIMKKSVMEEMPETSITFMSVAFFPSRACDIVSASLPVFESFLTI